MLDRRRAPGPEHDDVRPRVTAPPPAPVRGGSLAWASAVGNHAVARLAREAAEEEEHSESPEAEAEEADVPALEDLPDELPS